MKTYTTTAAARIGTGILALSLQQASTRTHALRDLGDGQYEILQPVEFKVGETFGYDQEIPRVLAACLEESGEEALEDLDQVQLLAMANTLGLSPHSRTGKPKLLEAIRARQDQLLAEQEAKAKRIAEQEAKAERIAELEAKGEEATEEELAELEALKA